MKKLSWEYYNIVYILYKYNNTIYSCSLKDVKLFYTMFFIVGMTSSSYEDFLHFKLFFEDLEINDGNNSVQTCTIYTKLFPSRKLYFKN